MGLEGHQAGGTTIARDRLNAMDDDAFFAEGRNLLQEADPLLPSGLRHELQNWLDDAKRRIVDTGVGASR